MGVFSQLAIDQFGVKVNLIYDLGFLPEIFFKKMPRGKAGSDSFPGYPKGAKNAFSYFVTVCREEHAKRFPDEQCEPLQFNKMAELDKKRFATELNAYSQTNPDVPKKRKARKPKDPRAPKRSMSAFFHYASDERPKVRAANPNFAVGDIAKELGRRWAEADPSHKSKYEARAEKDRERYIKQKAEFQQVLEDEKNGIVHKDSKDIRKKFIDSDAEEEVEEAEPVEDDEAESE